MKNRQRGPSLSLQKMEHPILSWLIVITLAALLLWKLLRRNEVIVDKYDYLDVMSFHDWQEGREIRLQLESIYRGWINPPKFYMNLEQLRKEGLVECEIRIEKLFGTSIKKSRFRKRSGHGRPRKEMTLPTLVPTYSYAG